MRVVSFLAEGRLGYGVVIDDRVADVSAVLGSEHPDVLAILRAGRLDDLAEVAATAPPLRLAELQPSVPLVAPRIFCIGVNYRDHQAEMKRADVGHPTVFVRFASSVVAAGEPLLRPRESTHFDYEGELAVIIGRAGRRIAAADALTHVAGYSCFNDGSVRDYQRHTTQFTPGKNFDCSGAFGPWLVTTDELADPSTFELTTRLNGEVMQHATTDQLIFDIPTIINYLSQFTELQPGDVIATGTPGGVGAARDPAVWMLPGDRVEVDISSIGTLANPIASD